MKKGLVLIFIVWLAVLTRQAAPFQSWIEEGKNAGERSREIYENTQWGELPHVLVMILVFFIVITLFGGWFVKKITR